MTQRVRQSPVLGYNHNLRHGGRVFHVQTEDSGQGYARLHTHLFYEGTILSTKKQEYDPKAPEEAVRALMQQLHKAMIKELTHGEHDARIGAFFIARGEPATLEAPPAPAAVDSAVAKAQPELPAAAAPAAPTRAAPLPVTAPMAAAAPAPAAAAGAGAKPVVMVKPGGVRRPPVVLSSSADGVVVRRNVVINVGGGAPPVNGTPGNTRQPAAGSTSSRARPAAPVAASDGAVVPARGGARGAAPPENAPQPLASSRDIRMPWETPGPTRGQQPVINAADVPRRQSSREVQMPWDPPAGRPPPASDAFAGGLGDDKGLDEVILEYLSDDGETEDR
ncbi:MAG TPA: hypothetical protein VIF57_27205 [Polyangia bacterium]|jgi:hypothetical protein